MQFNGANVIKSCVSLISLLKGLDVIGALVVRSSSSNFESNASEAIGHSRKLAKLCDGENSDGQEMIGAVADVNSRKFGNPPKPQSVKSVIHEENQQKFVWGRGCLLDVNSQLGCHSIIQ
ncbi:hypothetical protein HS088_TW18G00874 [Tripterygium wilfordii]|uniref:Uncharacterized protein n=1 Tax=Tripterygium wilfordii TaxID=458696 RepID=A0A7J7CDI6_TRIWF|nr:hypothetical protein HS088_TW18G00874 [Tripterygium wilfordii]